MAIAAWAKAKIRNGMMRLVRTQLRATLEPVLPQLLEYYHSAEDERLAYHERFQDPARKHIKGRLVAAGVPVEDASIDIDDFHRWLRDVPELARYYGGGWRIEKCLEHYLAFRQLRISPDDTYIDVGGSRSPFAQILRKKRVWAYRLDVTYAPGRHGINIGGDAGATGLPDGYATAVSAQDAFSIFSGDADVRFMQEAARILAPRGRYAVVPLFLAESYVNILDPWSDLRGHPVDPGAKRVWRDNGTGVPFARHYSPESFHERIWTRIPGSLVSRVVYFENLPELRERYPEQHIYAFFMLCGEKRAGPASAPAGAAPAAAKRP